MSEAAVAATEGAVGAASEPRVSGTSEAGDLVVRVTRASLLLALTALLGSLALDKLPLSFGLGIGYVLSLGVLWFWRVLGGKVFAKDRPRPGLALVAMVLKLPVLAAIVGLCVTSPHISPIALFVGFTIPHVTLALLVAGGRSGARP